MNTSGSKWREESIEIDVDSCRVRTGFRAITGVPLAGGPIELEFFVEPLESASLFLSVAGDSNRQRPGQFEFTATLDGAPIEDPFAHIPTVGGPIGVVPVTKENPWRQPLVLNQFLQLETSREKIADGESGQLRVTCRRPLTLGANQAAVLTGTQWEPVSIDLTFTIRRDDAALGNLTEALRDAVATGSPAERLHPFDVLLSLRSVAHDQLATLADFSDPTIANRARQSIG